MASSSVPGRGRAAPRWAIVAGLEVILACAGARPTAAQMQVDLSIFKTDGLTTASPGQVITYTITVENLDQPVPVPVAVLDSFPPELSNVSWVRTGPSAASGADNIMDAFDLPMMTVAVYTVTATIRPTATRDIVNTAVVGPTANFNDPNQSNNQSTDITRLPVVPAMTPLTAALLALALLAAGTAAVHRQS